ncbi:MAG: hypothetical protein MO853_12995 [Candidatus Protistobacter heckmanni]|nr:hypothetical protein [Candidatus Protistobacter heckmanni]
MVTDATLAQLVASITAVMHTDVPELVGLHPGHGQAAMQSYSAMPLEEKLRVVEDTVRSLDSALAQYRWPQTGFVERKMPSAALFEEILAELHILRDNYGVYLAALLEEAEASPLTRNAAASTEPKTRIEVIETDSGNLFAGTHLPGQDKLVGIFNEAQQLIAVYEQAPDKNTWLQIAPQPDPIAGEFDRSESQAAPQTMPALRRRLAQTVAKAAALCSCTEARLTAVRYLGRQPGLAPAQVQGYLQPHILSLRKALERIEDNEARLRRAEEAAPAKAADAGAAAAADAAAMAARLRGQLQALEQEGHALRLAMIRIQDPTDEAGLRHLLERGVPLSMLAARTLYRLKADFLDEYEVRLQRGDAPPGGRIPTWYLHVHRDAEDKLLAPHLKNEVQRFHGSSPRLAGAAAAVTPKRPESDRVEIYRSRLSELTVRRLLALTPPPGGAPQNA